ncbi:hypothetical protein HDU83_005179 [Entophlyctis luteolus]|nr:hypothetical protein HDU83_005179 [Entophlyctis luteolus]
MELCILDSLLGASDADARVSALSSAGNRSSIVGAKTNNGNLLSITDVDTSLANFSNDALVSDALARGVDLREYANQIDVELKQVRRDHVLDYVSKHADLRSLAAQVADCDQMLGNMINLLEGFQVDLNKISVEIRDLQERSNDMNLRLKNRVGSHELLDKVLDGLVITPDLITKICLGEVNEFFLHHLLDLNNKMAFVKKQKGAHIKALKDIGPELERMRLKSAEKIREYLLKKIDGLRTPNTNIAIIQQNHLLKFNQLYWFLLERYSEAANEVRQVYTTTVQQYYLASFEKYIKALVGLQTIIADRGDLIGSAESQGMSSRWMGFSTKGQLKDRTNVYSLGDRVQVLVTEDAGIILTYAAEEQKLKFPYEALFKSICRLLMDNASSEYIFVANFFMSPWKKGRSPSSVTEASLTLDSDQHSATVNAIFAEIFEPTLRYVQNSLKQYIENSYDAVGILLCIRLNSLHLRMMQKRRIPCLESFMNLLNIMLWPRFQAIIDLHIESLRKIGKIIITRRYAEFSAAILALNDGFDDGLLLNSLVRLRNELESFLFRMMQETPSRKAQLVLLLNNHDLVFSVLNEYSMASTPTGSITPPSCYDEEKSYFANSLEMRTSEYVEEELKDCAASVAFLMEFVDRAELERDLDVLDASRFEAVALQFNNIWKQIILELNTSILQSFPNFQNGARILHAAYTMLLLFYKRFLNLFEKRFVGKGRKVHPVGLQTVVLEIKKNQPSF